MIDKRNVKLRDALLRSLAVATFTAVSATAFTPVAQARVLLDEVNNDSCDLGDDDTGVGSAADPFRISTVEDLAEVGDCDDDNGGYYYALVNDLDISPDDNYNNDSVDWNTTTGGWEPIGEFHNNSFSGYFDGNGYTISGLEIDNSVRTDDYIGLFSQMNGAVIKDLTVVGQIDADGNDYVGILAGGDTNSQISNVHIDADITDASDSTGGLIGDAYGTRMSNITTTGDIDMSDYSSNTGGIVGGAFAAEFEPSITDSSSDVNVGRQSYWADNVGGMVGSGASLRLLRASFDGSAVGYYQVGGLVGNLSDGSLHGSTVMEYAFVEGNSDLSVSNIGGLVGRLDNSTISGSSFHGEFDVLTQGSDVNNVGVIAGYTEASSYLINTTVGRSAQISVAGSDDNSENIGGIVGYADETTVSGALMNADLMVLDARNVGGLIGSANDTQLDSSVNRGIVSATFDDSSFMDGSAAVGGLVGEADDGTSVTNSTNKGEVTAYGLEDTYGVGGIVGIGASVVVTDNYNTGDITGVDNVAGVVGMLTDNAAVVQRNFSLGKLVGFNMDPDGIATLQEFVELPIPTGGITPEAIPLAELAFDEESNVVLGSDRADNVTGATELSAARLKTASELVALGWLVNDADRADWTISSDFNSGFPHLAWETVSEDISEVVGLEDATFDQIVTFPGGKRWKLRTSERNALNVVSDLANAEAYDVIEIHVYYNKKARLASKRGLSVKRWLVSQGVAQTITVFRHRADDSNPVGSVSIEALVD